MNATFSAKLPHPFYTDHVLYHAYSARPGSPIVRAWEFNGWQREGVSWRRSCYIHAGLSGTATVTIKGPDAKNFLQSIVINGFEKLPVGSMKHGAMCSEDGLMVLQRSRTRGGRR